MNLTFGQFTMHLSARNSNNEVARHHLKIADVFEALLLDFGYRTCNHEHNETIHFEHRCMSKLISTPFSPPLSLLECFFLQFPISPLLPLISAISHYVRVSPSTPIPPAHHLRDS